ncbi:MAG: hypothetical protein OXG53_18220 [Chloroflexi bacterium]|nr:hypothetical protein [Chloroflexota bacterium]
MSYSFEIFITGVTPAQAIRLFDLDVEEGHESYEVPIELPTQGGYYVFYAGRTREQRSEILFESIGMSLETYASCTRSMGHVGEHITTLVYNALHNTVSDFVVTSQFEKVIVMRKNGKVIVNSEAGSMGILTFKIFDMPHQFCELGFF